MFVGPLTPPPFLNLYGAEHFQQEPVYKTPTPIEGDSLAKAQVSAKNQTLLSKLAVSAKKGATAPPVTLI